MIELLNLLSTISQHVNATNIEQFVSLVEQLAKLAESVKSGTTTSN